MVLSGRKVFFQFIWIRVEGAFVTSCTLIFSRDILKTFFMGKQPLHFKNDKTRLCHLADRSKVKHYPLSGADSAPAFILFPGSCREFKKSSKIV